MNTYLVIITTALVLTQIVRVAQNTISLHRQNRMIKRSLDGLDDIQQIDIDNQRKMHRLVIAYLEKIKEAEGNL